MNFKKWIISSYIVVMLIPLITGVMLYIWLNSYNNNNSVTDYLNSSSLINKYAQKLDNPKYYSFFCRDYNVIDKKDASNVRILIYTKDGVLLYDSIKYESQITENHEELFANLYTIVHNFNYDSLKEPVFKNDELVGFFEVEVARSNWVKDVNFKQNMAIALFILSFALVLLAAIIMINKKLNDPIYYLMNRMSDFAEGKEDTPLIPIKNNEIGILINHFEDMKKELIKQREKLKAQEKAKEYMIAAVSHDLKTPLTSIRAYAETLSTYTNLEPNDILKYSSIILNKSDIMYSMLDDLLIYSAMTEDFKISPVNVEGYEFFEMLFSGYDEICHMHNIALTTTILSDSIYSIDVKYMTRVIDNLFSNALRYTESGGKISLLAISSKNDFTQVIKDESITNELLNLKQPNTTFMIVRNTGGTIKPEDINKVFEPFYQTDDARNKSKKSGTGLGLSIAKTIVEKHGGRIKIISTKDTGTLVVFTIKEVTTLELNIKPEKE